MSTMNTALQLMTKAARQGKLTHFAIFHGGSIVERRRFALYLAKILNCLSEEEKRPCEHCVSCHKINSGNHPDVSILEPVKTTLGIEQILTWQTKVYRIPYEGKYKVFLLEKADALTLPAGNALLKVVEEPPPHTLIILSADNGEGILPTLRSRAQSVYFSPLSWQEWQSGAGHLRQEGEEKEAQAAFALSGGNADLAEQILDAGLAPIETWLQKFWESVKRKNFLGLFALFPLDKEEALIYLQVMAVQMRNGFIEGTRSDPKAFLALGDAVSALREQANPRVVVEVLALKLFD